MCESENMTKSDLTGSKDIFRVGVRVPPFWPEKPAIWFAQIEGQFAISNITADTTKFFYVVSHLDPRYASEVEDIIVSPPADDKYGRLKTELIKRLSESREKKVHQLLTHEELGDRKPSQFLRHLQHLAGPKVPDEFLRTIWSSRLPSNIQSIIASQSSSPLEVLADLADKIHDVVPKGQVAAASSQVSDVLTLTKQMTELVKQVEILTRKVNDLTRPGRSRSRSSSRHRSQSRSDVHPTCWYHYKFGKKATKCNQPCNFDSENPKSSQ
ncbi:uncharacterized protein LOC118272176 [Spodoptera frugiperda]|uniref:Uncharacterized protein LOC118272176 n=1 Tax=Spodoptera frugiperda TaxID=7108 RepID=A0A9R0D8S3_SPOFR|nr:uncharacterized protein LOC118272176 [Spodoptera frugiperda]